MRRDPAPRPATLLRNEDRGDALHAPSTAPAAPATAAASLRRPTLIERRRRRRVRNRRAKQVGRVRRRCRVDNDLFGATRVCGAPLLHPRRLLLQ